MREAFPRLHALAKRLTDSAVTPGLAVGIWCARRLEDPAIFAFGKARSVDRAEPLKVGTWFDLASLTKVMVTAPLLGVLKDRGWIDWEDPVRRFLPRAPDRITLRHLLSHTAGYPAWKPYFESLRREFGPDPLWRAPISARKGRAYDLVLEERPSVDPGSRCEYSDLSFLMLGRCLETVFSASLDRAAQEFVFRPMRLKTAHFVEVNRSVEAATDARYAATELCPWRGGVLQGQVHDDNAWAMGGVAPHAGLFADAWDVVQFGAACLTGGFLKRETQTEMWTRVTVPAGCDRALGWDTPSGAAPAIGSFFSRNSVGHLGFTGTSLWIDLERQAVIAVLANRVHPARENPLFKDERARIHEAIAQDLKSLGWIE